ncbi:carbon-nitrogen hydrolase family protein [Metallumcola ferriviriculae]|uniref:Carbon-nitrogen hydrolase family protein n=1 Tax=Metallumcola ferriviriculae TaxID=3039180 RepID=A0AAU0UST4_9FIRM|nr:carbon-nitrogen hydrolase family protein [Desulfitibacteraceae bacterium MK1]
MLVKVASVQMNPKIFAADENIDKTVVLANEAITKGANLVVFPECSLTGYCYESENEATSAAISADGESLEKIVDLAKSAHVWIVVGMVEKDAGNIFNSFVVIGPKGVEAKYRKSHLSNLGVDNFVLPGNEPFTVIETPVGKLGPLVCYDVRFPEHARVLALEGAEILVHITNLPITASAQVDYLLPTRANENRAYVVSSDRIGEERGFKFLGRSSIFGVHGEILAQANDKDETIIFAELDLDIARKKQVYYPPAPGKPVEHINDLFGRRRPELYNRLIEK